MKWAERFVKDDWLGVHAAANIFVATTLLWFILRTVADLNPIWAIGAMIAASDPIVRQAVKTFHGRITNALLGCAVGMLFLVIGESHEWKMPLALAVTILISTYVVRVPIMWRQAPITAAIIIASGLQKHSKLSGVEVGLRRVGEVLLGCVVGVTVSWLMSKVWRVPEPKKAI